MYSGWFGPGSSATRRSARDRARRSALREPPRSKIADGWIIHTRLVGEFDAPRPRFVANKCRKRLLMFLSRRRGRRGACVAAPRTCARRVRSTAASRRATDSGPFASRAVPSPVDHATTSNMRFNRCRNSRHDARVREIACCVFPLCIKTNQAPAPFPMILPSCLQP